MGLSGSVRWGLLGVLLLGLAPSIAAESPPVDGPYVRSITLDRQPVFSERDQERLRWLPLAFINRLHVDTRHSVIRRELVIEEGARADEALLAESARKLRRTGFFSDVRVESMPAGTDSIDVVVHTREGWTTEVSVEYERFEESILWSASLRERNFLGTARALALSRRVDDDRSTWAVSLADRQLIDGTWRARVAFAESDDGPATSWMFGRPFFSLDSDWAWRLEYSHAGRRSRLYLDGRDYVRPYSDRSSADIYVLRRLQTQDDAVWRLGLGIEAFSRRYAPEFDLTIHDADGDTGDTFDFAGDPAENRVVRAPYLMLERATRRFGEHRYVRAMGAVEDIPMGAETTLRVGWSTRLLGGTLPGVLMRAQQSFNANRGNSLLLLSTSTSGIFARDKPVGLVGAASATGYLSLRPATQLAAHVLGATGSSIDRDRLYSLGIDSGLRAASFREFIGDRLLRANVEFRHAHDPGVLGVITPAIVGFADFGVAWYEREMDLGWDDIRGAVGVGARIGFRQATQIVPIRIDLAWPILYDNDRPGAVLSIGTGHVF